MTTINGTFYVPALNGTLINSDYCTTKICAMQYAELDYVPSNSGNMAYLIIFAIILLAQLILGPLYKTWGFFTGIFCGIALEVVGYGGRLGLHSNVFSFNYFVM